MTSQAAADYQVSAQNVETPCTPRLCTTFQSQSPGVKQNTNVASSALARRCLELGFRVPPPLPARNAACKYEQTRVCVHNILVQKGQQENLECSQNRGHKTCSPFTSKAISHFKLLPNTTKPNVLRPFTRRNLFFKFLFPVGILVFRVIVFVIESLVAKATLESEHAQMFHLVVAQARLAFEIFAAVLAVQSGVRLHVLQINLFLGKTGIAKSAREREGRCRWPTARWSDIQASLLRLHHFLICGLHRSDSCFSWHNVFRYWHHIFVHCQIDLSNDK